jgi:atlastin
MSGRKGTPLQIVSVNDDHSLSLNENALHAILLNDNVKEKPVVIISVAGGWRKGKSFLLNFLIHYLELQVGKL